MTRKWWKAAGVRAVKTVAQAAIAAIGTTAMLSEVDWLVVASTASRMARRYRQKKNPRRLHAGDFLTSILTSI